jgi:Fanconi anemia group J protein
MSILGSKEFYCIDKDAKAAVNVNEHCDEMLEMDNCTFYHNAKRLSRYATGVFDIEDLVKLGKKEAGCPYYAARIISDDADIVFMPYNYLIDPLIRESCDIKLEKNIVILDEAHNIEGKF